MLQGRKKYSRSPRLVMLLSLVLLTGSFFSLAHASQHLFHQLDQGCEVFLSIEKNSTLDSSVAGLETDPDLARHAIEAGRQVEIQATHFAFSSRAPPSFLSSDCVIPVLLSGLFSNDEIGVVR